MVPGLDVVCGLVEANKEINEASDGADYGLLAFIVKANKLKPSTYSGQVIFNVLANCAGHLAEWR